MGTELEDIIRRQRRFSLILAAILLAACPVFLTSSRPFYVWVQTHIVDIGVYDGCMCVDCAPHVTEWNTIIELDTMTLGVRPIGAAMRTGFSGLGLLAYALLIGPIARSISYYRNGRDGICDGCGYDLGGLPQRGVCPECGGWFDRSLRGYR